MGGVCIGPIGVCIEVCIEVRIGVRIGVCTGVCSGGVEHALFHEFQTPDSWKAIYT